VCLMHLEQAALSRSGHENVATCTILAFHDSVPGVSQIYQWDSEGMLEAEAFSQVVIRLVTFLSGAIRMTNPSAYVASGIYSDDAHWGIMHALTRIR
jgi:hypothetical protein